MKIFQKISLLIALTMSLSKCLVAQTTEKPSFKQVEIAYYKISGSGDPDIFYYAKIDRSGLVTIREKFYDGSIKYFRANLTDSILADFSQIFNGITPLQRYITTTVLENGTHYAGPYNFISYTATNGNVDKLCYIDAFMSKQFNLTFKKIRHSLFIYDTRNAITEKLVIDDETVAQLKKAHLAATYLPQIESPPPGPTKTDSP